MTSHVGGQLISPCLRIFKYELPQAENDRWYGVITLLSDTDLSGVWLRIILDKPAVQLGNWFGEVKTIDNQEYLIRNRSHKLQANQPFQLRFYINYNSTQPPPQLKSFRLNARTRCPEQEILTTPTTIGPTVPVPSIEKFDSVVESQDLVHPLINPSDAQCGTVIQQPKSLLIYGTTTQIGEFPWHAAIYYTRDIDLQYICGGSLISPYHVLTAAHCVTTVKTKKVLGIDSIVVYLGKYYLKRWASHSIQDRHVEKIIVHPEFDSSLYSNDIAIIRLSVPADITNFVRPICLWDEDIQLEGVISKIGIVIGWGFDETGRITDSLTKGLIRMVSQETCIFSHPDFYARFISNRTFCAGYRNGTSVCSGDSGGGLVFPKSNSPTSSPIWQLRGIVSLSVAAQKNKCDTSNYIVFTDVAKYLDWIKANVN